MARNDILLFPHDASAFDRGGIRLAPLSCVISEEAGGDWRLEMTLPRDDAGHAHRMLRCGSIITAPVPDRHIPLSHIYPPGETVLLYRVSGAPVQSAENGAAGTVYRDVPLFAEKSCITRIAFLPHGTVTRLLEEPEEGDSALHISDETGQSGYARSERLIYGGQTAAAAFRDGTSAPRQPFRAERIEYENGQLIHVSARHISFDAAAEAMQDVTADELPLWQFCEQMTRINRHVSFLAGADIAVSGVYRGNALQAVTEAAARYDLLLIRDERRIYLLESGAADRHFTPLWGRDITRLRLVRDTGEMITSFIPLVNGELLTPVPGRDAGTPEHDPPVSCIVKADSPEEADALIRRHLDRGWDRPETGIEFACLPGVMENAGLYDTVTVREPLSDTLYTGRVTRMEYDCLTCRVTDIGIGRGACVMTEDKSIFSADDSMSGNVTAVTK